VIEPARPVRHGVRDSLLIGGYQVDALLERIEKVARTELAVVVTGESGTGKELAAREVHRLSGRKGPFQAINCAALPSHLIESELFGYRKGAFTGAAEHKTGIVKSAHGGTLFLDEIGDMPMEAQAKLLRVLQEKEVLPLGATTAERVDVRVVAATNRDLDTDVEKGRFRGDLLARLREFLVNLPPLAERREDLHVLVQHFLKRNGRADAKVSFPYMLAMSHYDWPYNVRELESAVKLSIALGDGRELDLSHLPDPVQRGLDGHGTRASMPDHTPPAHPVPGTVRPTPGVGSPAMGAPSEGELRALLARHRGNIAAVGRELGKERMQIHRWLKRYEIDVNDYRQ
jgi:DNA-binding NtrC family response regulator